MVKLTIRPLASGSLPPHMTATVARSSDAGNSVTLPATYTETEFLVVGSARTYSGPVTGPVTTDEHEHPYCTRVLVRAPTDAGEFSGRVVVEPFNTSAGQDVDVIWARTSDALVASGDGWVGVSQRTSSETTLKAHDPQRYGMMSIPSNDLAWDIIAQVGAIVRDPVDGPFAGRPVAHVYLAGYSQSGGDTATFAMCFHDRSLLDDGSPIYDGYFPASHSGSFTQLQSGQRNLPSFETTHMQAVAVPVVAIETQTDVQGFKVSLLDGREYTSPGSAWIRRDDSDAPGDRYRLYELGGAPHAFRAPGCEGTPSTFPASAFIRAALVRLFRWVEDGVEPPAAPRLELLELGPVSTVKVDEFGNAAGGVRSPHLDVPLANYLVNSSPGGRCILVGQQTLLPSTELADRYGNVGEYMAAFSQRLDETIETGYLLEADRANVLATQASLAEEAFNS